MAQAVSTRDVAAPGAEAAGSPANSASPQFPLYDRIRGVSTAGRQAQAIPPPRCTIAFINLKMPFRVLWLALPPWTAPSAVSSRRYQE